jgi:cytochrome c6
MEPKRTWTRILATALLGSMFLLFFTLPARSQAGGETLYKSKCVACHGADGKGETAIGKANKMNDLGSPDVQKQSDVDLTATITNGKNKMPAYGKSLKPDQIKDLVAYIRTFTRKS